MICHIFFNNYNIKGTLIVNVTNTPPLNTSISKCVLEPTLAGAAQVWSFFRFILAFILLIYLTVMLINISVGFGIIWDIKQNRTMLAS